MYICCKNQNWGELDKNIGHFALRPEYILLLLVTLNCHKNAEFE